MNSREGFRPAIGNSEKKSLASKLTKKEKIDDLETK